MNTTTPASQSEPSYSARELADLFLSNDTPEHLRVEATGLIDAFARQHAEEVHTKMRDLQNKVDNFNANWEQQRILLKRAEQERDELRAEVARAQRAGNGLYSRIVELIETEFFAKVSRDLEWDVLPGNIAGKMLELRTRAENAEARATAAEELLKAAIEMDVFEEHSGGSDRREWGQNISLWLYPDDIIIIGSKKWCDAANAHLAQREGKK